MKVYLDYGDGRLEVDLPDDATVIEPQETKPLRDPAAALLRALREPISGPPLHELVRPGDRVAISVCDGTRPQPREVMLGAILSELTDHGAAEDVTVLIASGTHRLGTSDEIRTMLGEEVLRRCQVICHDCRETGQLLPMGTVAGDVPVALNRTWVEADVRISLGLMEPHSFAGFSGGPKMIAPGLAALETVLALHNARRIGDPRATWGVVEGNPVHDAIRATAATAPPAFSVDVLLDSRQRITHVFSGELFAMHARACEVARRLTMRRVPRRFPLVITSSSGYPLDQNLQQALKGVSAAAEIVTDGGTIVCAAECRNGLPNEQLYTGVLQVSEDIRDAHARILKADSVIPDQWQVQLQAQVQERARVLVKTYGVTPAQLRVAHLEGMDDINAFVRTELERNPTLPIAVLPSGSQCIPFVG
ncbi:MAG: nickel-dependent lactate racemase [bacterium]